MGLWMGERFSGLLVARDALRRCLPRLFTSVALVAAPLAAGAAGGTATRAEVASAMKVEVVPGNWGGADPADIQAVLESVAREFQSHVAAAREDGLRLRVMPRGTAPRVLFERADDGAYIVHLTARGDRWYQYAYQFSHELCHVFSNFDHKHAEDGAGPADANQWFEETLCETASLFTLKRLAVVWDTAPPARKWIGYAPAFAAYADHLLAQAHRRLPAGQSLAQWYRDNRAQLNDNPYLREKNELLATALLPLFEQDSSRWQAIAYLNADGASAQKPFADYLADWYGACPLNERALVRDTMALLGIAPEQPSQLSYLAR